MLPGTLSPDCLCQPELSSTRRTTRSGPVPASRAKSARVASNGSFETVCGLSPVADATKAVTQSRPNR